MGGEEGTESKPKEVIEKGDVPREEQSWVKVRIEGGGGG